MSTEPSDTTPVQAVAAVAVRNGRVLLIRSRKHGIALPAGKVQPGESHEAALRREVREETGLEVVRVLRFLCTETETAYHCHHYEVEVADGEPVAGTDAEAAWWGTAAEAAQSAFPLVRELVTIALDRVTRRQGIAAEAHDESPVQSPKELDELLRLRAELSYADWKAHLRFKRERVMREGQRKWGVPAVEALFWSGMLPAAEAVPDDETDALVTLGVRRG